MKALTVRQPWAELIVRGYKDVENRTWPTSFRGTLAIHAGAALADSRARNFVNTMAELGHGPLLDLPSLTRGAVIGTVDVVACVRDHGSVWAFTDHWHWVLGKPVRFDDPIPVRGTLSLWDWDRPAAS